MNEKEYIQVYLISGIQELSVDPEKCEYVEEAFESIAHAENTLRVDFEDPEKEITIGDRLNGYHLNLRGTMEMEITEKAAQVLAKKIMEMEEAKA